MIVHGFDTPEERDTVRERISKIQAQFVLQYVDKLQCPLEQKLKLMDAIAEGCRQQAVKEREAEEALIEKKKHRREER